MTVIFAAAAALIVYIVIGYPLLLALLARRSAAAVRKCFTPVPISILVPVRNGEQWLAAKLDSLLAQDYPREFVQILVVSNGSRDATEAVARTYAGRGVELLSVPVSSKAAALNAGMRHAGGELLLLTDVRQPLNREALRNMVSCFGDPSVGAVSGHILFRQARFGGAATEDTPHLGMYWRYEKWIRRNLSRLDSLLVATGCIFAIRKALAQPIPEDTLADDAFLPLSVVLRGYRVVHESGAAAYEMVTSLETDFARKVRTLAGLYQLLRDYPRMLGPANRLWFHFWSYKIGRLVLPFALLALAAASFGLSGWMRRLALGGQGVFYGMALAHRLIPARWPLARLSSVAYTFTVLMAASLCAVSVLFVSPARLWRESKIEPAAKASGAGKG